MTGTGGDYVVQPDRHLGAENTSSLNTATPDLHLSTKVLGSNTYAIPPKQKQQGAGTAPTTASRRATASTTRPRRPSPGSAAGGCCSAASRPTTRSISSAGLERHPDAAGDVRQRQALGRARHRAQPGRRPSGPGSPGTSSSRTPPAGRSAAKMALAGLPGRGRGRPHLPDHRGHGQWPRRDGLHLHAVTRPTRAPRTRRSTPSSGVGPWAVVPGGAGQAADDGFTSLQGPGGQPAAHPVGRLRRGCRRRQPRVDRQRVRRRTPVTTPPGAVRSSPVAAGTTSSVPAPAPPMARAPGPHWATGRPGSAS